MHVCAVARGNDVAAVRVLAATLARHHPDWPLSVLVMPGIRPALGDERFAVLAPGDLGIADIERLSAVAPLHLLDALMRPALVSHLMAAGSERLLLLAPDAEVHGALDELEADLDEHPAVLIPRLHGRLPHDRQRPDGQDLIDAGEVDDSLVAVRGDAEGAAFVEWWFARAHEAADTAAALRSASHESGRAARLGASPLSAAPRVFAGLLVSADPGYGASYWNLHERPLARAGGVLTAAGRPLRLMRWAGFRADRPWWLSDHASRTLVLDDPMLSELAGERAVALRAAGWLDPAETAQAAPEELGGGLRFDERLRRLYAEAVEAGEDFGDLGSPVGADAFASWLREPAPAGASAAINRYSYSVWRDRSDVQGAYADLDGADGEGFAGWLWVHGREELGLQASLLPPAPDWVEGLDRRVPPVLVTGYFRGNLGLGEAARGYLAALQAGGVPVATHSVATDPPVERRPRGAAARPEEREFTELELPDGEEPEVNLVCVNADQLPGFASDLGEEILRGRHTIGVWAWETDLVPERWDSAMRLVDEVWTYSTYVAEHISRAADVPVIVMPLPVEAPDAHGERVPFDLPESFCFLFAFDFFSTLQRKNPIGLVEAFTHAFAPNEGPTLLLKTINAGFRPEAHEHLRHVIGGRDDIRLMDVTLSPAAMAALYASADCYVSLHRSEGYGLTLAESMALGKPVIATGYSGNTDFMTPANSYLVDYELTEVGPHAEHYPADGTWAEPSVEHAAVLMREVWEDQAAARERGARAREDVRATLSRTAVGSLARARLGRIAALRHGRAAEDAPPWPLSELRHRLHFDLGGGNRNGPRNAARRAVSRAMRPYTASERVLDETIVASLHKLQTELAAARAARERDRRRLERLERRSGPSPESLLAPIAAELPRLRRKLDPLVAAARALPYTAGEPFELLEHPIAGRVLGFRESPVAGEAPYAAFESIFRGSRERVAELLAPYVALLRPHAPVLDVGCGRGELLEALAAVGVEARGIELDAGMAAEAHAAGLDVTVGDAVEHLGGLADESLGAVTAMHVIEHLPHDSLAELLRLARLRLRPGGLFVAETVNPHAGASLKTFWVDLTHEHPIFPEVALVVAASAGFGSAFVFHPRGSGDVERDRFEVDSYTLVATA